MRKLALALAILSLVSCKKDKDKEEDVNYSAWSILKVEGSTTGTVNQTIPITVTFAGSCAVVDRFAESRGATKINITLLGYPVKGWCTADAMPRTIIYNFNATQPGTYELHFANNAANVPHIVTVN